MKKLCPNWEPHPRHDWIEGVTRRDCPGCDGVATYPQRGDDDHIEQFDGTLADGLDDDTAKRPSVWFLIPAHGRVALTRVCLRQLVRTCAELSDLGVDASAIVMADDENLDAAVEAGFGAIETGNSWLGRKWNDGYELAGREGVDFVVPFGSDDWVMSGWVLAQLGANGELRCSRQSAVVSEDGRRLATLEIRYENRGGPAFGDGVRMIPTSLLSRLGYRPADDDRNRGIDTSVWMRLRTTLGREPRVSFTEVSAFQIVDWKSAGAQLNTFNDCLRDASLDFQTGPILDPWLTLRTAYPAEALSEMAEVYARQDLPVAA